LGDWLLGVPKDADIFSEQELRRLAVYPEWVPRTELHRPDGYSKILVDGKLAVIAFEVELTHKEDSRYEILAKFYDREPSIYRVLWLVESETSARYIQKRLMKSVSNRCLVHDFVSIDDFSSKAWMAPILLGFESGKTISFLMNSELGTACNHVPSTFLLDGRRTPYRSPSYAFSSKASKCDRVGPYPIAYSSDIPSASNRLPEPFTSANVPEGSVYRLSNDSPTTANKGVNR
jgi:hypothetical protein